MHSVFSEMATRTVEQAGNRDRAMWHAVIVLSPVLTFINYSFLGLITYSVLIFHVCTLIQPTVPFLDHRYCEWYCLLFGDKHLLIHHLLILSKT